MQVSEAKQNSIKVSIPAGTFKPGCEIRSLCYIPDPITIKVGDVVEWKNNDSAPHTVTSGSENEGPNGIIYSSLIEPGEVFAFRFTDTGSFPYYCTLHPWKEGLIIVEDVIDKKTESGDFQLFEQRISKDGSVLINIETNPPVAREPLDMQVSFTDEDGDLLIHLNYDITIIQDGEEIFNKQNMHATEGMQELTITTIESDNPIDIQIGIRGIYLESDPPQPVEEVLEFQKVPEFGVIAAMILFLGLMVPILLRSKNGLSFKPA